MTRRITVNADGSVSFIYGDDLAGLLDVAAASVVTRASHVEPAVGGGWTADMGPTGGPVLGPFALRQAALDAEVAWLQKNRGL